MLMLPLLLLLLLLCALAAALPSGPRSLRWRLHAVWWDLVLNQHLVLLRVLGMLRVPALG